VEPLRAWIAERERVAREAKARSAWAAITKKLPEDLTEEQAFATYQELVAFTRDHGKTFFAGTVARERASIKARLDRVGRATEKRLARLFKGQIKSLNLDTRQVTVHYDFSSKEQATDFEIVRAAKRMTAWQQKGHLKFIWPITNAVKTNRFMVRNIELRFRILTEWNTFVRFGTGVECGLRMSKKEIALTRGWNWAGWIGNRQSARNTPALISKPVPSMGSGLVAVRKEGRKVTAHYDGQPLLEGTVPQEPAGSCFSIGSIAEGGFQLDDLTIIAELDKAWLEGALKDEAP
jgi:hypothetical protein